MARQLLYLERWENERRANIRRCNERCRILRSDGTNFTTSTKFIKTYRLSKNLYKDLLTELEPLMKPPHRSSDLAVSSKVLTALSFYATGSYQALVGQNTCSSMSQPSVSRSVHEVTAALNSPQILHKYIKFPQNIQERDEIKIKFYNKFGLPGVIGCIDGTQVAMIKPKHHEERYWNRKWYHSRNVQIICDSELNILNVDASFGGATHDSFIWNQHIIKRHLIEINMNGENTWLLGDSGYAQRDYMMTPIVDAPDGTPEAHYSAIQMSARNTVERTIGVLKARWRCLLAARELHYDPEMVGKIINACCVLHNICNQARLRAPRLNARENAVEDFLVVDAPDGTPEAHYSAIQMSARNTVERTIGVLKARWRCLLAARELHYDPEMVGKIINACCVLHNICNQARLRAPRLNARENAVEDFLVVDAPDGTPEAHYSAIQMSARNTVERTIGVLKARWRCLLAARELHYDPEMVGKIINACCVLHNICNQARLRAPRLNARENAVEDFLVRGNGHEIPHVAAAGAAVPQAGGRGELHEGRMARALLVARLWEMRRH